MATGRILREVRQVASATSQWVVRPIAYDDRSALAELAAALGPGMTTLPADPQVLNEKIEASVASFAGAVSGPDAQYLMVLEDVATGAVLGTAAVYPSVGDPFGFFSYKLSRLRQHSKEFDRRITVDLLTLANDFTGATEIGTLAVRPTLRGGGAGRLLARSRYMLIASFPQLFGDRIMAEMRGWQEADGHSPFWQAVGARFFGMDFPTADRLSAVHGAEFIADLMPRHPIYADLLPDAARAAIGKPHQASAPAMAMLLTEGFRYEGFVDVFDAGPQVSARPDEIRTIAESCLCRLGHQAGPLTPGTALVSAGSLESFRVAPVAVGDDGELGVDDAVCDRLMVAPSDTVRLTVAPRYRAPASSPAPAQAKAAGL